MHTISHRVARHLERDEENSYLNLEDQDEDPMQQIYSVFWPNSKHRRHVTPARRGKGNPSQSEGKTPEQRHQSMTWAQRLKRVFNIDVSICPKCEGEAKVIASIEDQTVIDKILQH
jgi:hypothetical protein